MGTPHSARKRWTRGLNDGFQRVVMSPLPQETEADAARWCQSEMVIYWLLLRGDAEDCGRSLAPEGERSQSGENKKVGWSQQRGQPVQMLGGRKVLSIFEELKGQGDQDIMNEGRGPCRRGREPV